MTTSFIDERPQLLTPHESADRATKLLTYLAGVTVNKPHGEPRTSIVAREAVTKQLEAPASGSRQKLRELRPAGFAKALRETAVAVTDTTFRRHRACCHPRPDAT